jgi:branched-chain amino acid transport system permease protein
LTFAVLPALFTQYLHGNWLEVPTMLFGLGAIGLAREPRGLVYRIVDGRRKRRMQRITRRNASRETEPVAVAS